MDKFLENCNLPRLNQDERENIKRSITSMEIKTLIKNLPKTTENPHKDTDEFYQSLRRASTYPAQTPSEFETLEESYRLRKTPKLIPQTEKDTTNRKRKLQANITDVHRCKNPQQNSSKQNPITHQKDHTS